MSDIQGMNHTPKFCEKCFQSILPIPVPHFVRQSSYEMFRGGEGREGSVMLGDSGGNESPNLA